MGRGDACPVLDSNTEKEEEVERKDASCGSSP